MEIICNYVTGVPSILTIGTWLLAYVTVTYVDIANNIIASSAINGYTIYKFSDTSVTALGVTITGTITPNFIGSIEYLIVARWGVELCF